MGEKAGIGAQAGVKKESVFGTYVAPTVGIPFISESMERVNNYIKTKAMRQGRLATVDNEHALTTNQSAGGLVTDLLGSGMGPLLDMLNGDANAPTTVVASTVFKRSYAVGLTSPNGKSLSLQIGRPDTGGTVRPYSYLGSKVTQVVIKLDKGGVAGATWSIDSAKEDIGQALATLAYDDLASTMKFQNAVIQFDGVAATDIISSGTLTINLPLATDRFGIGRGATKAEQILNDQITATLELTLEFGSLALHTAFVNATRRAVILDLEGDALDGTHNQSLVVTCPKVVPISSKPMVTGPDIITQDVVFDLVITGSSPLLTLDYQTSEA